MLPEELTPKEPEWSAQYNVAIYLGSDDLYEKYGREATAMYLDNLASTITQPFEGHSVDKLTNMGKINIFLQMSSPTTYFVALTAKGTDELVGFSTVVPAEVLNQNEEYLKKEKENFGEDEDTYQARKERTAHVEFTIIKPEHRGKKGWSHMMNVLDTALKASGQYDEVTRVTRDEGNYSQKMERRYGNRVVTKIPNIPSPYGPQTYFRIRL